uniref:Uncharacterized protein n=1 Tax=Leptospirillum ferrodiazotrophum TaxID=412449 RepID=C6HZP8_9BACT|nr:MAG: hypothetical protein UBAL3_95450057 [Leptospirillum ferrodiazotrophum]
MRAESGPSPNATPQGKASQGSRPSPKGKRITVLDLLREEGFQEGFQIGYQQEVQRRRDETITRLLRHSSLSPREIASILEVDLSRVLSLAGTGEISPRCPDPGENSHT